MVTIQVVDLADVTALTLQQLGRFKWSDISLDLQEYVGFNQLMQKNRITWNDGDRLDWNVQVSTATSARNNGLYEVDTVDVEDFMQIATVEWRNTEAKFAFEAHARDMNRGASRILDFIKPRLNASMGSYANVIETNTWTNPADSSDKLKPFGIPYYVVWNATEGFNGSNPSGYTAGAAGLNSDTFTRWKNYTAQHASIADLVKKMRKASRFVKFIAPMRAVQAPYGTSDNYGYYTTYSILASLEERLEAQNQNLGNDIASKDGRTLFKGNPVIWAPKLEDKDSEVLYGINWGKMKMGFLSGWFMKQNGPKAMGSQRHIIRTYWDNTYQLQCFDRRSQFVIADADPGEDV